MISYPLLFSASAKASSGTQESWQITSQTRETACAIPPEFGGAGDGFSPEDLFAQALTNCFVATFKVYAENSRIDFKSVDVNSELVVDFGEAKLPIMKQITLNVKVAGASRPERIRTLAEKVITSGFILNSVKTEVRLNLEVL
jgi:organic hydroperoxide reductase OsmC/OhrA